jgi:hypothetical protein
MTWLVKRCRGGQVRTPCSLAIPWSERAKAGGLQVGGGITDANAQEWIDAGASKV